VSEEPPAVENVQENHEKKRFSFKLLCIQMEVKIQYKKLREKMNEPTKEDLLSKQTIKEM